MSKYCIKRNVSYLVSAHRAKLADLDRDPLFNCGVSNFYKHRKWICVCWNF